MPITLQPRRLNFSKDPLMLEFQTANAGEENLSCSMSVHETTDSLTIKRVNLNPVYGPSGNTKVDLSHIAESLTSLPLPNPNYLLSTNNDPPAEHLEATALLNVVVGDKYGNPPGRKNSEVSNLFAAVKGGSTYWNAFSDAKPWYLLHSFKVHDHLEYRKVFIPTTIDQPQVLYFLADGTQTITLTVDVRLDNQTQVVKQIPLTLTPSKPIGVFSVYVGVRQLRLMDLLEVVGGAKIVSYDINIGNHKVCYLIDDAPSDFEYYILYSNGCGGMETARFSGRHKLTISNEKTITASPRWTGSNHQEGIYRSTNNKTNQSLEINSGYHTKEYIQHLAAMIRDDVWLCDPVRKKIYRYTVQTSQVIASKDLSMKHNLKISIRRATDAAVNTFGI